MYYCIITSHIIEQKIEVSELQVDSTFRSWLWPQSQLGQQAPEPLAGTTFSLWPGAGGT